MHSPMLALTETPTRWLFQIDSGTSGKFGTAIVLFFIVLE